MKKFILALMLAAMCGMVATAATKYEINVAGVEVTSDNCSNITGGDIESGYAVYSPSTNTLTCYNIYISRLGSGSYGIHNRKCDDLTIVFKNTCYVFSLRAPALKLERSTTIKVDDQTKLNLQAGDITGSDGSANTIEMGSHDYFFTGGKGTISIRNFSPQAKDCFKGNGNSNTCVVFSGGVVTIKSDKGYAFNSTKAYFRNGSDARIQPNGSKQSFYNSMVSAYEGAAILEPFGAYSDLNNTVYNSSGTAITNQDIYISSNFVAIFKKNWFDDENFCQALLNIIPKGYITSSDVPNITSLDVSNKNISSIVGIQWFSDLKTLNCSQNNITSFNISMLSKLQTFDCSYNQVSTIYGTFPSTLTNINLYSNNLTSKPELPSGLQYLDLGENKFEYIDIRSHSSLKSFSCSNNRSLKTLTLTGSKALTVLNASGCSALTSLECRDNALGSGFSVSGCTALTYLNCDNNKIPSLNVSGMTKLEALYCANNLITSISNLDNCSSLKELNCSDNQLSSLPSSSLPLSLEIINCANNKFTTLQIVGKSNLKILVCRNNTSLTRLECRQNALTTLSVSGCTALSELYCNVNKLTSLSLSGLNALSLVQLNGNQIKKTEMGDLINSLRTIPAGSTGQIYVLARNSQSEGNEITTEQVKIARNKRWIPYHLNNNKWEEIPGGLKGDVNGDGKVNVSDVTALINMIMGITTMDATVADVNGDGKVNVSDVSALINIILGIS